MGTRLVVAQWTTIEGLKRMTRPEVLRWGRLLDAHDEATAAAQAAALAAQGGG